MATPGYTLPQPPNINPVLTLPDADAAIRGTLLQYLARLVTQLERSFVNVFATATPGLITNGGFVSFTLTMRNVAPPQPLTVGFSAAVPAGVIIFAVLSASETVTVTFLNQSGANVTLGAGTIQVQAVTIL